MSFIAYAANRINAIHMIGLISFIFPLKILRRTQESIPHIIPFAIDDVKGIIMIARNAAIVSAVSFSNSTFFMAVSMRRPTHTSAGVVAKLGIARNTGAKIMATMKRTEVVSAVRPVRPPFAAPADDST